MKLSYRQIDAFVTNPDPAARVILVYGPDSGLMKERMKTMAKSVVSDLNDPFNVAVLSADMLGEDPARLGDEAGAISMMGGDRLIRVTDGTDKITPLIKSYLEDPNPQALIIIEAGELGPRSSLRGLCERADNAAAVPCYVEDARDLPRLIREVMQQHDIPIERSAVEWLAGTISGNRQFVRQELEKIVLYKGSERTPVSLEDVQNCCAEAGNLSLDDLIYGVAGRNPAEALQSYTKLQSEGMPFIVILRSLQNHFRRLHYVRARTENGEQPDQALSALKPPVFFKQKPAFTSQIKSWSTKALANVLMRLTALEEQCKQTGTPVETVCAQALLAISTTRKS